MTINSCDSQSALHRQEIHLPQWLILCVLMSCKILRIQQQMWLLIS